MTRNKDQKRIIRGRMKKTGESYTAARSHIIAKAKPAPVARSATLAGMSDDKISAKTGRTWQEWVRVLDADDAAALPHRDIAVLVHQKHGIGDWWAQTVTVGYERIKGLRERGQRRGGSYEATKSRTFDVPVKALFRAWADDATRRRWVTGVDARVRSATAPKSVRLEWPDGTVVAVGLTTKSNGKSLVALTHMKLPDKAALEKARKYWTTRLNALAELLGS